ncbi:hypothetical protein [Tropicimonas sp. IMCC6043]|uniref:hypothetical protein n=1 Tax=Tropicimonas sp. IMCC6043 TaxID=2510645 RepID=UPI00101C797C|nr:hypothetical protein [Tropicimonas sp. IMCC6043]RYH12088.1 hypothetical protein EU800_00535 [Tropicimonas sp. IMCC6043]
MADSIKGRMSLLLLFVLGLSPATAMAQATLEARGAVDIVGNPPRGIFQSDGGVVATTQANASYRVTAITRQQSGIGQTTTWVQIAPAGDPNAAPLGWVAYPGSGGDLVMSDPPRTRSVAQNGLKTSPMTTRTILEMAQ